jgi:hypothetical protein
LKKVENFQPTKTARQITALKHQFTTITPQIHHHKNTLFPNTPLKNARKHMKNRASLPRKKNPKLIEPDSKPIEGVRDPCRRNESW